MIIEIIKILFMLAFLGVVILAMLSGFIIYVL